MFRIFPTKMNINMLIVMKMECFMYNNFHTFWLAKYIILWVLSSKCLLYHPTWMDSDHFGIIRLIICFYPLPICHQKLYFLDKRTYVFSKAIQIFCNIWPESRKNKEGDECHQLCNTIIHHNKKARKTLFFAEKCLSTMKYIQIQSCLAI